MRSCVMSATCDLVICATLLHSLCLQNLICSPPLHRLQADPIHLIQQHREQPGLHAVRGPDIGPRPDQRVDLVEEQNAGRAGAGLPEQLHVKRQMQWFERRNKEEIKMIWSLRISEN